MSGPPPDRTVEVCREFTRQRCQRGDDECRYAHPPPHVEVVNGRVTCCVDSIKVCAWAIYEFCFVSQAVSV